MKPTAKLLTVILILLPGFSFAQSKDLKPGRKVTDEASGTSWTPIADRTRVYDAEKQYIVFEFWNESDPMTEKEKQELQQFKQQLSGKNVEVIEFQYKTSEDLEKILKDKGIEDVSVSTEDGISIRSKNSHYNTSSAKAIFVFEGKSPLESKRPIILSSGEKKPLNYLKVFFKLRSFS